MIIKHIVTSQRLLFVAFLLYIVLIFFGIIHHEPWRDEAHAWLSAKEETISQMMETARFDPVPFLWRSILIPFAKSGFPYFTMSIIHACLAIATIFLLFFFSKIPIALKILFAYSYYMAYEYAVVARSYVLTCLCLFAIAALYRRRLDKPLLYACFIALLFQTNIHSVLPAIILVTVYCYELFKQKEKTIRHVYAAVIMCSVGLVTLFLYTPTSSGIYRAAPPSPSLEFSNVLLNAITSSITFKMFDGTLHSVYLMKLTVEVATAIVIVGVFVLLVRSKSLLLIAAVSFFWQFYINIFLNAGTLRHHGLLLIYLMFFLWIAPRYSRSVAHLFYVQRFTFGLFGILLSLSIIGTVHTYIMEYRYNFSGAEDMAQYIIKNKLIGKNFIMYTASDGQSLLPYVDKKYFWYPQINKFTRYYLNDERSVNLRWMSDDELINSSRSFFKGESLYLMSQPIKELDRRFVLLHASLTKRFWGNDTEQFWLYKKTH